MRCWGEGMGNGKGMDTVHNGSCKDIGGLYFLSCWDQRKRVNVTSLVGSGPWQLI